MRRETLPVILGMPKPRYQMVAGEAQDISGMLGGYDVMFLHATFPEGVQRGGTTPPTSISGLGAWLHFTDPDVLRRVGQNFIDYADKWEDQQNEQAQ